MIKILFVLISSVIANSTFEEFSWEDGNCTKTGKFNSKKYTKNQIENIYTIFDPSIGSLDFYNDVGIDQINNPAFKKEVEEYCNKEITKLKSIKNIKNEKFEKLMRERITYVESSCNTFTTNIDNFKTPSLLKKDSKDPDCLELISALDGKKHFGSVWKSREEKKCMGKSKITGEDKICLNNLKKIENHLRSRDLIMLDLYKSAIFHCRAYNSLDNPGSLKVNLDLFKKLFNSIEENCKVDYYDE